MKRFLLLIGTALPMVGFAAPAHAGGGLTISLGLGYPVYGYPYFHNYQSFPSYPYYVYTPYYTPPELMPATPPMVVGGATYFCPPEIQVFRTRPGLTAPCRKVQTMVNGAFVTGMVCPQSDGSWRYLH